MENVMKQKKTINSSRKLSSFVFTFILFECSHGSGCWQLATDRKIECENARFKLEHKKNIISFQSKIKMFFFRFIFCQWPFFDL